MKDTCVGWFSDNHDWSKWEITVMKVNYPLMEGQPSTDTLYQKRVCSKCGWTEFKEASL